MKRELPRSISMKRAIGRLEFFVRPAFGMSAIAIVVLGCGLTGCISAPTGVEGYVTGVEQDDFYAPPSFDLVRGDDYKKIPELRSWTCEYVGKESIGEVKPKYVSEMPKLGWRLITIEPTGIDSEEMIFYKGDERASVRLSNASQPGRGGRVTLIEGHIRPRELISLDQEARAASKAGSPTEAKSEGTPEPESNSRTEGNTAPTSGPGEESVSAVKAAGK